MSNSMAIAATGMQAQQRNVETIANNLANVDTPGFKRGRVVFTDLVSRDAGPAIAPDAASGLIGASEGLASGVSATSVGRQFDGGELKATGFSYDLAVRGDGFLEVMTRDGTRGFVRGGSLKVGVDGLLETASGYQLKPGIVVPGNAGALSIGADGRVLALVGNDTAPTELGQLELSRFMNPSGLIARGDGVYISAEASGEPIVGRPGDDGLGTLAQGYLEASNVRLVDEMLGLVVAQRAYEASAKLVQAADEMAGMINGLRR